MNYAGFWKRAAAFLIDAIIATLIFVPLLFINASDETLGYIYLFSTIFNWLYFAFFESGGWMATPGKRLIGISVVGIHGNRISFARATGRYFAKFFSSLIFCIGYIMAAFTKKKQALHDIIADTLVISSVSGKQDQVNTVSQAPGFADTQTIIVNRNHGTPNSERLILAGFDANGHVVRFGFSFDDPKLYEGGLIIGRDSTGSDLHIKDQSISRRHARVFKKNGDIWIEDLGSTNGILVNGKLISKGESALLSLRSTLVIGGIQLALGKD